MDSISQIATRGLQGVEHFHFYDWSSAKAKHRHNIGKPLTNLTEWDQNSLKQIREFHELTSKWSDRGLATVHNMCVYSEHAQFLTSFCRLFLRMSTDDPDQTTHDIQEALAHWDCLYRSQNGV
jgi:hypothetical protein